MFTEIKRNHIQNVVVDLRGNGGGNSLVADEFIRYLDIDTYKETACNWRLGLFKFKNGSNTQTNDKNVDLQFTGKVYLLTSSSTFSSGMMFAEFIKDNELGTIIGEAPGNTPTGYGDIAIFQLPNSKLCFQVSTKEFFRADISSTEKLVEPDIPCDSDDAMDMLYTMIE
jgi:C-terminal processing protease CtpA/Prc